jgi:hypothetical protein
VSDAAGIYFKFFMFVDETEHDLRESCIQDSTTEDVVHSPLTQRLESLLGH